MVDYKNFECRIQIPELDLGDITAARRAIIGIVNDPKFEAMLGNLKVGATYAKDGPAPRDRGEFNFGCNAGSGGNWSCGAGVTIRF